MTPSPNRFRPAHLILLGLAALAVLAAGSLCGYLFARAPSGEAPPAPTASAAVTSVKGATAQTPLSATPSPGQATATARRLSKTPRPSETPSPGKTRKPTRTPQPTNPPPPTEASWPDPIAGQTASKLSIHVMGGDAYTLEYVRRVHPRLVKAVDNFGWLQEVAQASPETIIIARRSSDQHEEWVGTLDPAAAADQYIQLQMEHYQANPSVDYWEGWNEFVATTPEAMQWFAQFEARRVCQMQALGYRAAVGGFSLGTPEYSQMEQFLPALEAARRCGGVFTLHEGVSGRIGCGIAVNPAVPPIPGAPQIQDVAVGYIMLRYRFWYEGLLKPRGWGDLPLVISELSMAPDANCGPANASAMWKDYSAWWIEQGVGASGPEALVNLLAWYDSELRRDPYVLGTTIFTAGAANPDDQWFGWDIHDVIIPLARYAAAQR
jgi:hypothetical protein